MKQRLTEGEFIDFDAIPGQSYNYAVKLLNSDGATIATSDIKIAGPVAGPTLFWTLAPPAIVADETQVRLGGAISSEVNVWVGDEVHNRIETENLIQGHSSVGFSSIDPKSGAPGTFSVRAATTIDAEVPEASPATSVLMTSWISSFASDGVTDTVSKSFNLVTGTFADPSRTYQVNIRSEEGTLVRQWSMTGKVAHAWDGKNQSGVEVADGAYTLEVRDAVNLENGKATTSVQKISIRPELLAFQMIPANTGRGSAFAEAAKPAYRELVAKIRSAFSNVSSLSASGGNGPEVRGLVIAFVENEVYGQKLA